MAQVMSPNVSGISQEALAPLVELLARAAFEGILRGEFKESGIVSDPPPEQKDVPTQRPAA